ncbi:MAG: hypothetical protein JWO36_6032 [Myxococcales bacterium]|nr:hypothetical protein [Myxococcales bacterium]
MRYAAFLRGVSPLNAKMPELKRAFEAAGFTDVKTVVSSGNVVFSTRATSISALERKAEAAMTRHLDRSFLTIIRPVEALQALLASDPYRVFELSSKAKRVVTFLRVPPKTRLKLPIESDGAGILAVAGNEVLSAYVPGPRGPVFMRLIEKACGKDVTTRTWDTIIKVTR